MKLVMLCDYGLDDAVATYDVLRRGNYDCYDILPVGGNVPKQVALRNAKKLLSALDFSLPNVRIVDTSELAQKGEYLADIHGDDGMGDLFPEAEPKNVPLVKYSEWMEEGLGEFDLLSLGPMTLAPLILEKFTPRKFVFMAGNIAEVPNFHGYEFNHALDKEAFAKSVKYAHVAITMDTCRNPLLNVQNVEEGGGGMMGDMVRRSRQLTFRSGEIGCYIWDDMAVKYLLHPEWFSTEQRVDKDGNLVNVARYTRSKRYFEIIEE